MKSYKCISFVLVFSMILFLGTESALSMTLQPMTAITPVIPITPVVPINPVTPPIVVNPPIVVKPLDPGLIDKIVNPDFQYTTANGLATITKYVGNDSDVVIPSQMGAYPVTAIGPNAFHFSNLTSVVIPEGVIELQTGSFSFNENLKSITLPSTLKIIGEDSFVNSKSLTEITLPDSLEEIGEFAFVNSGLNQIIIPSKVKTISSIAFDGCKNLQNFIVNPGNQVFSSREGILYKDNDILFACPITKKITEIPAGTREIGSSAFRSNKNLTEISIPSSVKFINGSAFLYCSNLKKVVIPASVEKIGLGTFSGCTSMTDVEFKGEYTKIDKWAFKDCISLTNVKLPSKLDKINYSTFSKCNSLKEISIPSTVTAIDDFAFSFCYNLNQIKLPSSVDTIGAKAFLSCTSLTDITIPEGVVSIGNSAFEKCSNLTSLNLPSTITQIGKLGFESCTNLKQARFYGDAPQIGKELFANVSPDFKIYYLNSKLNWSSPTWNSYLSVGVDSFVNLPLIPIAKVNSIPISKDSIPIVTDKADWDTLLNEIKLEPIDLLPKEILPPVLKDPTKPEIPESSKPPVPGTIKPNFGGNVDILINVGKTDYLVNQTSIKIDASPVNLNGRIMLPVKYIAEPLGATVNWNKDEQKVTITNDKVVLELWIGKNIAMVNGKSVMIDEKNPDVKPVVIPPGRTMLPLRFIAEQLGCDVEWIAESNQVKIKYPRAVDKLDPQPEPPMDYLDPQPEPPMGDRL